MVSIVAVITAAELRAVVVIVLAVLTVTRVPGWARSGRLLLGRVRDRRSRARAGAALPSGGTVPGGSLSWR